VRILPVVVYVLLIFFVSTRPNLKPPGPEFPLKDKAAHFSEYCLLGVLLFRGIGWTASRHRPTTFLFLLSVGASVGAMDEIIQSYVPGRSMSIYDWLADFSGVALGVAVFVFTRLGKRNVAETGQAPGGSM